MPDLVRDALGLVTGQVGRPVTYGTVDGGLHRTVRRENVLTTPRPRPAAARLRSRRRGRPRPRTPTDAYVRDVRDLGDVSFGRLGDGRTLPTG
ncbi:hypothetical protein [Microtetraspora fusca]|uniref:hypothetical protein n=1 Tax=Microtetraspora fusca TaxID=1997 RepID=UPI00082C9C39|nr:hypothetical protein [Microtetraspora fusca]